jgi:hypothetical protein
LRHRLRQAMVARFVPLISSPHTSLTDSAGTTELARQAG